MRSSLYLATMLAASSLAAAETPLTIDQLLAQGWEIAGYASHVPAKFRLPLALEGAQSLASPSAISIDDSE